MADSLVQVAACNKYSLQRRYKMLAEQHGPVKTSYNYSDGALELIVEGQQSRVVVSLNDEAARKMVAAVLGYMLPDVRQDVIARADRWAATLEGMRGDLRARINREPNG